MNKLSFLIGVNAMKATNNTSRRVVSEFSSKINRPAKTAIQPTQGWLAKTLNALIVKVFKK